MDTLEALQFPIGKFIKPSHIPDDLLRQYLHQIKTLPEKVEKAVHG